MLTPKTHSIPSRVHEELTVSKIDINALSSSICVVYLPAPNRCQGQPMRARHTSLESDCLQRHWNTIVQSREAVNAEDVVVLRPLFLSL